MTVNDQQFRDKLLAYVPPPKVPRPTPGRVDRAKLSKELGVPVPDFLWDFGSLYGNCGFRDEWGNALVIHNPHDASYIANVREWGEIFESVYDEYPDFPYRCYPAPGGLLPIGYSPGMIQYVLATMDGYDFVLDERTSMHDPNGHPRWSGIGFYEFIVRYLQNDLLGYEYFHPPFRLDYS